MMESIFFNPWIWLVPVFILLAVAMVAIGVHLLREDDLSMTGILFVMFGGLATLGLIPSYFGFMLPPYDASFYQTYRVTGELTTLEKAFDGEGGTLSQAFVATVDGVDLFINSDDQRFRSLSIGDDVNLVCTKQFQYFVDPWLDCRFGG